MFRAHLKAHTSLLAFSLSGETPTHEQIAVQNILYVFYKPFRRNMQFKRFLTNTSSTTIWIESADTRLAYMTLIKGQ